MIKTFSDFIFESKQVGTIYHFTTILSLIKIFDTEVLGDESLMPYTTISFTRDKNFHKRTKIIPTECRIEFDGDKLSTKYKIKPFQYHEGQFVGKKWDKKFQIEDQMEEVLIGVVKNPFKYINEIVINEIDLWDKVSDDEFQNEFHEITGIPADDFSFNSVPDWLTSKGHRIKIKTQ